MKIDLHFEDGPISADIEAKEDDEFSDVLEELADFVVEYHKAINDEVNGVGTGGRKNNDQITLDSIRNSESGTEGNLEQTEDASSSVNTEVSVENQAVKEESVNGDSEEEKETDVKSSVDKKTDTPSSDVENGIYRPIVDQTGISKSRLEKVIDCGDEQKGPRILASNFLPGDSKKEKTLNGTIVLLTLWKTCHDKFWKNTADIIKNLDKSGIKDDRFKRIYNNEDWDSYLQKKGEKRGTELGIVPIGEDRGFELIEKMVEEAGV
ncbi:MAG: hypothetical protein ABEI13_01975 [Candidatus Paceibacteria bacterium]